MKENKVCERSVARLYAVLAVFQYSHSRVTSGEVIDDFLSTAHKKNPKIDGVYIDNMHIRFFRELFEQTIKHLDDINPCIKEHLAKDWAIDTIDPVALCILQLGVCEILYFTSNPSKVILKEYGDVAGSFFNRENVSFINGILNVIARKMRPNDTFADRSITNERNNT